MGIGWGACMRAGHRGKRGSERTCVLGVEWGGGPHARWTRGGYRQKECMPAGRQAEGRQRETLKSWQLLQLRSPLGASRRISVPPNSVLYTAFPSPVRPRLLSRSGVLSEVVKQKRGTSGFGSARSRRDVGSAHPGSRCPAKGPCRDRIEGWRGRLVL